MVQQVWGLGEDWSRRGTEVTGQCQGAQGKGLCLPQTLLVADLLCLGCGDFGAKAMRVPGKGGEPVSLHGCGFLG